MHKLLAAATVAVVFLFDVAFAAGTPAPANAYVYIGWPTDGQLAIEMRVRAVGWCVAA